MRTTLIHASITGSDFTFAYTMPEIVAQVEMCYTLIAATIPCLRVFLYSANTGLFGASTTVYGGSTTSKNCNGSSKPDGQTKTFRARGRRTHSGVICEDASDTFELTTKMQGHTAAHAEAYERSSVNTDGSEEGIMVRQTVEVQYDA